jgi:hypothetical protein
VTRSRRSRRTRSALKAAGEWLGDEAYNLLNPDEAN